MDIDKRLKELEKEYNNLLGKIRNSKEHMKNWFTNKRKIEILAIKGELEHWKKVGTRNSGLHLKNVNGCALPKPIKGLMKEDFLITVDGKEVKVKKLKWNDDANGYLIDWD